MKIRLSKLIKFSLSAIIFLLPVASFAAAVEIDLKDPLKEAQSFYEQIRVILAIIGLVITTSGLFTGNSFLKLAGGFVMAIFAAVFLYDVGIAGYLQNANLAAK